MSIEIQHIHKQFGSFTALSDINLNIESGELVALLGPSGCGKTTLLRIIAGLIPKTSGSVRIRGAEVDGPQADFGFVFQSPNLMPWRTVLDNVLFPMEILGKRDAKAKERALELLDMVGLAGFGGVRPHQLSGGMQQRVALCRALVHQPSLLLMDEPFGALDAMTRDELNLELQRVWMGDAKTVFFVTHSIPEAVFLGDRVVVMSPSPGRIVETIDVNLPRPRDLDIRETPEFGVLVRHIRGLFQSMGVMHAARQGREKTGAGAE